MRALQKPKRRDAEVVWCDRGWQPVYFGFCPSRAAWNREMRKMGCNEPYPASEGRCSYFDKDGKTCAIVTLGPLPASVTRTEVAGLICHEATHVWQEVRRAMAEKEPSKEFEAYAMQSIFQGLYQAWLDTSAPNEMLSRGAKVGAKP